MSTSSYRRPLRWMVLASFASALFLPLGGCESTPTHSAAHTPSTISEKVTGKDYPSVFQAWNPLDMPGEYPLDTLDQRIQAAAKHDLFWEEPVSQLSFGTQLVLGVTWNHTHTGLATGFEATSYAAALENRKKLLALNPNMVMLMEVRWRDAPGSYLPEDSPFWKRNPDGTREAGWKGGPEPYYMLNYENPDFQDRVAEMAKISVESGVFDGIMLDWSGHLDIIKKARAAMGDNGLINVNIHDYLEKGQAYKDYINGAFMECNPPKLCSWEGMKNALVYYEKAFQKPTINGLEVWGERGDIQKMRATTALGLTYSEGSVLYADPNPLPTPDHLHNWYDFWDISLGKPKNSVVQRADGASHREYDAGLVVYNPPKNGTVTIVFDEPRKRASNGNIGKVFKMQALDGDYFLHIEK